MGEKVQYRYFRDEENRPVVTVCDIFINDELVSKGIAICSLKDNPCKRKGRRIARQRAIWALKNLSDELKIKRREAFAVLSTLKPNVSFSFSNKSICYFLFQTNECLNYNCVS